MTKRNTKKTNALLTSVALSILVIVGNAVLIIPLIILTFIKYLFHKVLIIKKQFLRFSANFWNKIRNFKFSFKFFTKLKMKLIKPEKKKKIKEKITPNGTGAKKAKYFIFGFLCFFAVVFIPHTIFLWLNELPNPSLISDSITKCTKIVDRKERLLYEICPDKKSDPIKFSEINSNVINATLAIEDANFYRHKGFDIFGILRASREILFHDTIQGGSTITQQLVKLTLLSPERTLERKLKELVLALMVEMKFTKNQILEMYLNSAPYGGAVVGIETASERFFGKKASELTLSEASLLAGLPSAPSIYSPYTAFTLAKQRQKSVLTRMVELKYISQGEADSAYAEELKIIPQIDFIRAPHFVDYVRSVIEAKYGSKYANFGGLTVKTTLDVDLNDAVTKIVKDEILKDKYLNVSNGAVVVLDSKTGEILAMVGSVDYFDIKNDGYFNTSTAFRLPGSTIKAVTYSLALSKGYKTTSIIDDSPLSIRSGLGFYTPVNYDGAFHGKVSLRKALANSYNIPAVKVLMSLKIDDMVNLGKAMGLTNWVADGNYGPAITLGGKETRLLDLTNVYATLARAGVYTNTKPILEIKDARGYSIYSDENKKDRVLSEEVSYIMSDILSDYYARLPAFGVNNFLSIKGRRVAVKTGTTDFKKDNYTVGYTPSYTVGVWVGNNNNSPMNPILASGLTGAAPIWNQVMTAVLTNTSTEDFLVPLGIEFKYFKECGNVREVFIKGTAPKELNCKPDTKDQDKKDKKEN